MSTATQSPLLQMAKTTPTDYWNDSCSIEELTYGLEHGAVGATSNPVIVYQVLQKEMHLWEDRIKELIGEMPAAGEDEVAWKVIEEVAVKGAELLLPVYREHNGRKGRLSIQTNPKFYRNRDAILKQALHFNTLSPNMQVKIPATKAGIAMVEEATYQGVSLNITVSFSVPQVLAAGEAIERGLQRREQEGKDVETMSPICTIMVGRVDDWLKVLANKHDIITEPGYIELAGVAVMKNAYRLFRERGYRARLLAAAYRNHYQWSQFIGGELSLTIPYKWARRFNGSDVPVVSRIDEPVAPEVIDELSRKFPDFVKMHEPDGMTVDEFDELGATKRTLRQFIEGYSDLVTLIREFMISNPDK